MIDIEKVKNEIVDCLLPMNPDKIILFGSYAYESPTEESDIDLFLLKDNLSVDEVRSYQRSARSKIRGLIYKYKVGFDVLSAPTSYIESREDYFYKVDLLQNGVVLYE